MGTKVTKDLLWSLDRLNRQYRENIAPLPTFPERTYTRPSKGRRPGSVRIVNLIPQILLRRLDGLKDGVSDDPILTAMLASQHITGCRARLHKMIGHFPEGGQKQLVEEGVYSRGLTNAWQDYSLRSWIDSKPVGWSAGDWMRAIYLRTANLRTSRIPSNSRVINLFALERNKDYFHIKLDLERSRTRELENF